VDKSATGSVNFFLPFETRVRASFRCGGDHPLCATPR